MSAAVPKPEQVLTARVLVPDHVVHRAFEGETVALNLQTGSYHGLNPTAARILEVLGQAPSIADALPILCDEFGQPPEVIERDVVELCRTLADRGLIELRDAHAD